MRVRFKKIIGVTQDINGYLTAPRIGEEVDVTDKQGRAFVAADAAEAVEQEESEMDATDEARKEAEEAGIDLASVEGTGSEGRITVGDVRKYVRESPGPNETPTGEGPSETR